MSTPNARITAGRSDPRLRACRIVLVRPAGPGNVGAVARVIKNFGLGHLVLVAPRFQEEREARVRAVHAADVLGSARVVDRLEEGVADCRLVAATTARGGQYREGSLSPAEAAELLLETAGAGPVALVFGPEDHGLDNRELRVCHAVSTVATSPAYPSLNLSHAVAIYAYELARAAASAPGTGAELGRYPPASSATMEFVFERLRSALLRIGFLLPENPEHILSALRRLLGRARPDEREARILLGLARQIEWYATSARQGNSGPAGAKSSGS